MAIYRRMQERGVQVSFVTYGDARVLSSHTSRGYRLPSSVSAEGWYDAIRQLMRSALLRQRIADQARNFLKEYFDREKHAEQLCMQIGTLLEEKAKGITRSRIQIPSCRNGIEQGWFFRRPWEALLMGRQSRLR